MINKMESKEKWKTESILSQSLEKVAKPTLVFSLKDLKDGPLIMGDKGWACHMCGKVLKRQAGLKKHWEGGGCRKGKYNSPEEVFLGNVKEISERYQTIKLLMENVDMYPKNQKQRDEYSLLVLIRKTMKLYNNFLQDEEYIPIYDALKELHIDVQEGKYDAT